MLHLTLTRLIALSDEGTYRVYDLSNPQSFSQYTLGGEAGEMGIVSARAYDDGFVVLTGALQVLEVKGWTGSRPMSLASSRMPPSRGPVKTELTHDTELSESPTAWTLISPDQSTSGHVEVLFSTSSTIVSLDSIERIDQRVSRGPFSHIRVSPNGRFIALITTAGLLWVVSADFARSLSEVAIANVAGSEISGPPETAEWCGDNAVVLSWGGTVLVMGPGGDALRSAVASLRGCKPLNSTAAMTTHLRRT